LVPVAKSRRREKKEENPGHAERKVVRACPGETNVGPILDNQEKKKGRGSGKSTLRPTYGREKGVLKKTLSD